MTNGAGRSVKPAGRRRLRKGGSSRLSARSSNGASLAGTSSLGCVAGEVELDAPRDDPRRVSSSSIPSSTASSVGEGVGTSSVRAANDCKRGDRVVKDTSPGELAMHSASAAIEASASSMLGEGDLPRGRLPNL